LCCLSAVFAQQKKYSARVFDGITYQPLSGASVYNMNTQKFAFTDKNGRFTIELSLNDTLIISKSTYRQHVAVIDQKLFYGFEDFFSLLQGHHAEGSYHHRHQPVVRGFQERHRDAGTS
jgi:hypothetical protein